MAEINKEETIVNIQGAYAKADNFLHNNKKGIYGGIAAVVLLVGGFLGYKYYQTTQNDEAAELIWKAEYFFEVDSLDKAINGGEGYLGFQTIASNYGGTKTGNLAEYYLGICYMQKGEFQAAIDHLEKCDLDDEVVGAIAKGSIGDAYVELGNTQEGIKFFEKAAKHSENNFTSPIYMLKAGLAYEKLGDWNKALELYSDIRDNYPNSAEGRDIEKYIAKAESLKK
ncbi:MAG: tetratricopeptide repeat protein [Bacteroidota bacterium]